VRSAQRLGITLRLMGASAVWVHCPRFRYLFGSMNRELSDIDFMTHSRFGRTLEQFLRDLNYESIGRSIDLALAYSGYTRRIYRKENHRIDVFFDRLDMCHTIDFTRRLEVDCPTISLADILLEKMQIVNLNPKDVQDTTVLLREHEIGPTDKETVNVSYVAHLLSRDWGFYYTARRNLVNVKEALIRHDALTDEDRADVDRKIDGILNEIDRNPKTAAWKIRAAVGPRKKWYKEVEEVTREKYV
jgi:hypothetical protein